MISLRASPFDGDRLEPMNRVIPGYSAKRSMIPDENPHAMIDSG